MSVSVHKLVTGFGLLSLLVFAAGASAAPSIGYPTGRPYYGSGHQQARAYRSYGPSYVTTEARQSFSHEPTEKAADANKSNADQPATPQAAQENKASEHVAAAARTTTRQSFSYQPSMQRHRAGHRDAWLYQKADARRLEQ